MKAILVVSLIVLQSSLMAGSALAHEEHDHEGHGEHEAQTDEQRTAKIEKNLSKLSPEERQLAEGQVYCPVMPEVRLGEMGPAISVAVEGETVLVCCKGCQKKALADPGKTLAAVEKLRERVAEDAEVEVNLSKLSSEDREIAAAQGYCAIANESRLGAMGVPIKLAVNGQTVFVCCKGCGKKAQANPEKTLASVEALKAKVAEAKDIAASFAELNPVDRGLARTQGYCPVMADNLLGTMGPPIKVMIKDQPVFLCCKGCQRKASANADRTLAVVAQLKAKTAAAAEKE